MHPGNWVLEADKEVRVWGIVRELAVPERPAVGPRLTGELRASLKFHLLPSVSLGWKAEGAAENFAAVLWAVALECRMCVGARALGQPTWTLS